MRKYLIQAISVFAFLILFTDVQAQQDAQYTQYMYNPQVINPAYAGSREVLSIVGLHRNQWVGVNGAPRTNTLSIHSPLGSVERVGLGASVVNDEIGPLDETYASLDFSYSIPTKAGHHFNFGIKGTAQIINIDFNKLRIYDPTEVEYANSVQNSVNPNVGLGAYYYTDKFYLGLSVPQLLETEQLDRDALATNNQALSSQDRINYYLLAGYVFDLSSNVKFKPALMTKMVLGAPLQVDFSTNFLINNNLTLGLAYRWDAAVSFLAGFQLSDGLMIGVGYDYETTDIQEFNNGSYEIMLRFELFQKLSRIITPRFF